ncbi:hypothetical protein TUMSATVNIG1_37230 [Vibrio nigripulchritudo]|uniref:hypothetical protein n=1 Tax=Vibrio nigripulchritudo TaxID=28173 RepID=UPI00190BB8F1|nr:hypothetical protein [Vibrio nigripulchritudo]BCL71756.1 hypothetical protein VNTUMSATTG_36930 [Vibrio nigripulchritudo]BDU33114.1 hypothetical protein TUMSATVNIG1_37230 [Vibrio nigripulchritudo]
MKKLALLISSALLVTACGGGGSGDGNSSTGGGSANLTKVTNDSARGMSGSAKTVDPAAARGVVNNFGSSGNQGVSQVAKAAFYGMRAASQSETVPCYRGNGQIVATVEQQQGDNGVASLSIDKCSLSDDLNILANGKLRMAVKDEAFTIDGNFVLRDENKAENLLALNSLKFAFSAKTGIAFSSTITADGNTHNVTFAQTAISGPSSNITTSLKIEGADSTWVEVVRVADVYGTEASCEVTQSAGLSLTKEDGCSLLRL